MFRGKQFRKVTLVLLVTGCFLTQTGVSYAGHGKHRVKKVSHHYYDDDQVYPFLTGVFFGGGLAHYFHKHRWHRKRYYHDHHYHSKPRKVYKKVIIKEKPRYYREVRYVEPAYGCY